MSYIQNLIHLFSKRRAIAVTIVLGLTLGIAPQARGVLEKLIPQLPEDSNMLLVGQSLEQQQHIALIIGNGAYQKEGSQLKNPVNDATDMAATLRELGFEVLLHQDLNLRQMNEAVNVFSDKLSQGGVGLFYYAGHGIQVDGENYLLPVDTQLARKQDVPYETYPVGKLLGAMEYADNNVNIIILDACRENPFGRQWRDFRGRSVYVEGLAAIQSAQGTMIAYATQPGGLAADGANQNGTYTEQLLQHIKSPGLSIEEMFKRVGRGVYEETEGTQQPWVSSSLFEDFSFNPVPQTTRLEPEQIPTLPPPRENPHRIRTSTELIAIGKETLSNLDRTNNTGTGFDYWPNGGIQIAYYHLATFATYEMLSNLSPHPVFVSGPHGSRSLNLNSSFEFGHYNPEFLAWFQDHLMEILNDSIFVDLTTEKFKTYLGQTLRTYWQTYIALNQNSNELNILLEDYKNQIKNRSLPKGYYYNIAWSSARDKFVFLEKLEASGNNSNVTAPAVYFWLRRYIDGTHEQMFSILESLLNSYNMLERKSLYYDPNALP